MSMLFSEETQLPDGPLVVTHTMPEAHTVALGFFIDVGSRDESPAEAGIAHALEHMLFKGTKDLDAIALNERLDQLGGTANAFTSRERTCFHIHVLRRDWPEALALLADMLRQPALPADEWVKEREVIFSEMAMVEDMPDDWAMEQHMQALFPGTAMGRSVLGYRDTLSVADRDTLESFLRAHYRPPRLMMAAAGGVAHAELAEAVAGIGWPGGESGRIVRASVQPAAGVQLLPRHSGQAHLVLSYPGIAAASTERPVAWLANQLLGGGMSSRLFREVREKRGLAYHVGSHLALLSDLGVWTVTCDTEPDRLDECIGVIAGTLKSFAETLTAEELARAKRQLQIQMRMGMDSVEGMMLYLGGRLDEPLLRSPDDWAEAIELVSVDVLRDWIRTHFSHRPLWTLSGPEAALGRAERSLQAANAH
jgi:predicted Zn-dependent peptidase